MCIFATDLGERIMNRFLPQMVRKAQSVVMPAGMVGGCNAAGCCTSQNAAAALP